jgi:eukaryotic-like serine/threonine-protein kinase
MNPAADDCLSRDRRLDEILGEYLVDLDAGRKPDRQALLERHPDLARELAAALDDMERFEGLIDTGPVGTPPGGRATVIACPHCHARIDRNESEAACPGCGARFHLDRAPDAPEPTRKLGKFELTSVLGRGAFGTVYKARNTDTGQTTAVKVPRHGAMTTADEIDRFFREARFAIDLKHPNIVRLFDVGQADGLPFLVSEFVPGRTLAEQLRACRPEPDRAARIVLAVAEALAHAHGKGVFHRDIKPSNILMRDDETPVLVDFGLARREGDELTLTLQGDILGAPAYMSPEQARGDSHRVDGRADIYSLGVVLYQLLTGQQPFTGNLRMVLNQIQNEEPRAPRRLNDRLPRDLETVCLKCLRKDPARRYQKAEELADDLRRYLKREPVEARPVGRVERSVSWCRRNPMLAAVVALLFLFLAATAAVSVGWAVHASRQSDELRRAAAETQLDRGLSEAERGDVGAGMLWLARALETAPKGDDDLAWTLRVNLNSWRKKLATLTACYAPPPGKILALTHDAAGAWFVDDDGKTVRYWDLKEEKVVGPELVHPKMVRSIAVSPDGTRVACGGAKLGVQIWDTRTGQQLPSPKIADEVCGLAYHPTTRSLLIGTLEFDGGKLPQGTALRAWDGANLQPVAGRCGTTSPVAIAGVPSGDLLTACEIDKAVRRWSWANPKGGPDSILRHPVVIKALAISPDGEYVLTAGGDRIARLWHLRSGRLLTSLPHRHLPATAVAFGPEGKTLLTASPGDAIRVWKFPEWDESPCSHFPSSPIRSLAVSANGKFVATGTDDGRVRVWQVNAAKLKPVGVELMHPTPIRAINFSPDGAVLATSPNAAYGAELWNPATGERLAVLPHPQVQYVSFSHDGRLAATVGFDTEVWLWDGRSGRLALPAPIRHGAIVAAAGFGPGELLFTAGRDGLIRRWNAATGASLGNPLVHGSPLKDIGFHLSDGGTLLSVGTDGTMCRWDATSGELRTQFTHGFPVTAFAFEPRENRVLTSGPDGRTRFWDVAAERQANRSLRHGAEVRSLAASPDGRWAVTACDDGVVQLWGIRLARPLGPSVRHEPHALCAAIDPAGRWAVTGGDDRRIRCQPAPDPLDGPPDRITLWARVATGAELDFRGDLQAFERSKWRELNDSLQRLGGPPLE